MRASRSALRCRPSISFGAITRIVLGAGEQRLGVRADHGDRRAQLVRDVRDEVPAHGLEPAHRGDVLEQQHAAVAAPRARDADQRARAVRELDLGARGLVALDELEQPAGTRTNSISGSPTGVLGHAEHPARGIVEQLDLVLAVDARSRPAFRPSATAASSVRSRASASRLCVASSASAVDPLARARGLRRRGASMRRGTRRVAHDVADDRARALAAAIAAATQPAPGDRARRSTSAAAAIERDAATDAHERAQQRERPSIKPRPRRAAP